MFLIKRSCIAVLITLVCSVVGQNDFRYDYRYNLPVEEYGQRQGAVPPAIIGSLAGNLIPPSSVLPNVGLLGGGQVAIAPPRPVSYAAPSTPAPYAAPSTPAPYAAYSTRIPYTAPTTSAPYTTSSTLTPYAVSSTPAPYAAYSTLAPYAAPSTAAPYTTPSTPIPYAAPSTPVPYAASPTPASYVVSPTSSPYAAPSKPAPYIPSIRPVSYNVYKKPSAPNTLAIALSLNATVSEYYQPHYSGPVKKPHGGSNSYRTNQRPN